MNKENQRPATSRPVKHISAFTKHAESPRNDKQSASRLECHDQYLRLIIASNADYFQSKLRGRTSGRSKDLRLKFPCRTGMTTYRKDYRQNDASQKGLNHHCPTTNCLARNDAPVDLTISATTNYQKDFKKHTISRTQSCRRLNKPSERREDDKGVPRFLETQNRTDFLNWAGKNCVASMKPAERSAVTNLPFEATSVYRAEFEGKSVPLTPSLARQSSFPRFGLVSAVMRSNYSREFCPKRGQVQASCRPTHAAAVCKQFKGTTEYKREFHAGEAEGRGEERGRTLEELQTLIIDL